MARIHVLDTQTANTIKAGEVIERPVSIVKELIDNSIDAGSTRITVEFTSGGIELIRVSDNGLGMDREDAINCFTIHATSKIKCTEDLFNLTTMGFRGEALPSIAAISRVELKTKMASFDVGTKVIIEGGELISTTDCSMDNGTVVIVKDIFYNTPARYKFLKKDSTEGMYICNYVEKISIVNPHISFKLIKDGKTYLSTPGNGNYQDVIYSIYGKELATNLIPVSYEHEGIKVSGFTSNPMHSLNNRRMQIVYVNDRMIKSATVSAAIDESYRNVMMKSKYAACFLMIYINPSLIDCNVHPQKTEVKFNNDSDIFRLVYHGIKNALNDYNEKKKTQVEVNNTSIVKNTESYDLPQKKATQLEIRQTTKLLDILSGTDMTLENFAPSNASTSISTSSDKAYSNSENSTINNDDSFDINPDDPFDYLENNSSNQQISATNSEESSLVIGSKEDGDFKPTSEIDELSKSKIIGFIFATYILLQSEENFFIVDQHAAHERILYEEFLAKARNKQLDNISEPLLIPRIIKLSSSDYSLIEDNIDMLSSYGVDISLMGQREIAIRALPYGSKSSDPVSYVETIINDLRKELPTGDDKWYHSIATAACKAAIKGHDVITKEEVMKLLSDLSKLEDPYHCPHGRPTFIKYSRQDIEKEFKRIV